MPRSVQHGGHIALGLFGSESAFDGNWSTRRDVIKCGSWVGGVVDLGLGSGMGRMK